MRSINQYCLLLEEGQQWGMSFLISYILHHLYPYLDHWRSITSNRYVLNMVQGHHVQLRCCSQLFHNFQQFNIKATTAHQCIIQKEVDELLAKGTTEPSSNGAGFYSNILFVPKHMSGLHPILNLKQFNHYIHIPTFKMPTIRQV